MASSSNPPRPRALPVVDLTIEIRRDRDALEVALIELLVADGRSGRSEPAQQLRWQVRSPLLPDELLLVFGKPLAWAGPQARTPDSLPHVEDVFPTPLALGPRQREILSGAPRVVFPDSVELVAWPFGIVLLRGHDAPLRIDTYVRLRKLS